MSRVGRQASSQAIPTQRRDASPELPALLKLVKNGNVGGVQVREANTSLISPPLPPGQFGGKKWRKWRKWSEVEHQSDLHWLVLRGSLGEE